MGQSSSQGCCETSETLELEHVKAEAKGTSPELPKVESQESLANSLPDEFTPVTIAKSKCTDRDLMQLNEELVRGVPLRQTLQSWGGLWRLKPVEMDPVQQARIYQFSRQVSRLDKFLSHAWHTPGWRKFLSLLVQSGSPFMLACWTIGTSLAFALCMLDVLPLFYTTRTWSQQQDMAVGCWVTLAGLVSGIGSLLVSPYLPRNGPTCFLDLVCVHQTDEALMKQGIYNIGGVLSVSANLHVLWSAPYLSRLWCVFELAAYRKMNPAGRITIAPLYLENFACQVFLCLHAISVVLSFGRIFYDLGQVFVLAVLGGAGVCSFPLAYSLRQHSLERQRLLSGLDTFEVREVECRDEFDRTYIHDAIKSWYGSLDAFSEYVRGPFRDEVYLHFQLPLVYHGIIMTPLTAFCLDFVVAMVKSNAPAGDVMAYILGFMVAQNMLWYPATLTLLIYACEHLPASAFKGNRYLQTLAISGGLWLLYALGLAIALNAAASERWWEAPLWTVAALVFAVVSYRCCWRQKNRSCASCIAEGIA